MALKLTQATVTGYKGKEKAELEGVLSRWLKLVNQYSLQHSDSGDECYWYNERATLGVLAAAAWQKKGWCALEEFSNDKHRKSGDQSPGRCDLYMLGITNSYAWRPSKLGSLLASELKPPMDIY